jgi:hypothetical protein
MKKVLAISLAIALIAGLLGASIAYAQGNGIKASKATAKVSELTLIDWVVVENDNDGDTLVDEDPKDDVDNDGDTLVDEDGPDTPYDSGWTTILTQNIKMPNQKDLLIDVSLETGLYTGTLVRSKRNDPEDQTFDTSTAHSQVMVRVLVDGNEAQVDPPVAYPRAVTFNDRSQTLSAKFMGIFTGDCFTIVPADPQIDNDGDGLVNEDPVGDSNGDGCPGVCDVDDDGDDSIDEGDIADDDEDGLVDEDWIDYVMVIDYDCLEPEELELILSTLSANSFNFVVADLTPGEHVITVQAKIYVEGSAQEGKYVAKALVGQGSVVIEAVRMIKGEDYLELDE